MIAIGLIFHCYHKFSLYLYLYSLTLVVLLFGTHEFNLNLLDPLINVYITTPKNTYIIYSVMLKATKTSSFNYRWLNGIVLDLYYTEYDSNFLD